MCACCVRVHARTRVRVCVLVFSMVSYVLVATVYILFGILLYFPNMRYEVNFHVCLSIV
jgi:hypothetical protein